jgi:ATP-binding cassette subfamily C protein
MRGNVLGLRDLASDLLKVDGTLGARSLALALAGVGFEGAGLMLLVPIIEVIGGRSSGQQALSESSTAMLYAYLPAGMAGQLVALLALFGVLMILRSVVTVARDISFARLNGTFIERTRTAVLERVAAAGWGTIASLRHERVVYLLSADFQACGLAGASFIQLCLSAIMVAMLLIVATLLSPMLAATMLLFLIMLAAILHPSLSAARGNGSDLAELGLKLTSDLGQFLAGLKLTLANNLGAEFVSHIRRLQREQTKRLVEFAGQQSRARAIATLAGAVVGALALLIGGLIFGVGGPELLMMLVVLARLTGPALQFQQAMQMLQHSLPTYRRIKSLEQELASNAHDAPVAHVALPRGAIIFDKVTYLHPDSGGGVRDLDLTVEAGSFLAVIGDSGAGKTTLADLLAGLLAPQQGSIASGGVDLTPANAGQWQNVIAYVPQDSFLINDSIRRNLLWGSAATDEAGLAAALRTVAGEPVVNARADGLEAVVGERGILLSGGERQRIALARALLRRPRLIILDEAMNAIDATLERKIIANLAALPDRPTIVAISHRAGALDLFDRVYRMEGGRLREARD